MRTVVIHQPRQALDSTYSPPVFMLAARGGLTTTTLCGD
jgi:hypothetical protein